MEHAVQQFRDATATVLNFYIPQFFGHFRNLLQFRRKASSQCIRFGYCIMRLYFVFRHVGVPERRLHRQFIMQYLYVFKIHLLRQFSFVDSVIFARTNDVASGRSLQCLYVESERQRRCGSVKTNVQTKNRDVCFIE